MSTPEINQLLHPDRIRVGLSCDTKQDAINTMVDLLEGNPSINELATVRDAVFEREATMSTGVGKGLGLPHAKTPAATETIAAFATMAPPIPFDAIDDAPVELMLLLVGPTANTSLHIKVLGRISRLVNRPPIREALINATNPEGILDTLKEAESRLLT